MAVIDGMTADQLRELADRMELQGDAPDADEHERRLRSIRGGRGAWDADPHDVERMREEAAPKERPGYVRHVEVEGIELDIDMRRVKDMRTLRLVAEVQEGGKGALAATLELSDFVLGDQRGKVEEACTDADGFVDAERYTDIFTKVFEAVGAKN